MATFEDVYQRYGKRVYLYLLSLTGRPDEAEELLAETFYRAFLHIDRFEGRSSIYTWLCEIGKNAWLKECKRKKRFDEREFSEIPFENKILSPEMQMIQSEEHKKVQQEIFHLKSPYREVFILHAVGEMKLKEIAALYSKSEEWARVTYYRAKSKLAKAVQEEGERG